MKRHQTTWDDGTRHFFVKILFDRFLSKLGGAMRVCGEKTVMIEKRWLFLIFARDSSRPDTFDCENEGRIKMMITIKRGKGTSVMTSRG